jgi:hypothetical protein
MEVHIRNGVRIVTRSRIETPAKSKHETAVSAGLYVEFSTEPTSFVGPHYS